MTTEVYTPAPSYTITGTGPYAVPHDYTEGAVTAIVDVDGETVDLVENADFYVNPDDGSSGNVTISSAVSTTYSGRTMTIGRRTVLEQGFAGQTVRETAVEAQLDRTVQGLQEVVSRMDGADGARADIMTLLTGMQELLDRIRDGLEIDAYAEWQKLAALLAYYIPDMDEAVKFENIEKGLGSGIMGVPMEPGTRGHPQVVHGHWERNTKLNVAPSYRFGRYVNADYTIDKFDCYFTISVYGANDVELLLTKAATDELSVGHTFEIEWYDNTGGLKTIRAEADVELNNVLGRTETLRHRVSGRTSKVILKKVNAAGWTATGALQHPDRDQFFKNVNYVFEPSDVVRKIALYESNNVECLMTKAVSDQIAEGEEIILKWSNGLGTKTIRVDGSLYLNEVLGGTMTIPARTTGSARRIIFEKSSEFRWMATVSSGDAS